MAAAASAAAFPTPSSMWLYVSLMIEIDECPRRLDTTAIGTPAASCTDAAVPPVVQTLRRQPASSAIDCWNC